MFDVSEAAISEGEVTAINDGWLTIKERKTGRWCMNPT